MLNSNIYNENFKVLKKLVQDASGNEKGSVLYDYLNETLQSVVLSKENEQELIDDYIKYLCYADIKYFTIKALLDIVKIRMNARKHSNRNDQNETELFTKNCTKLLLALRLPLGNTESGADEIDNLRPLILDDQFRFNYDSASNLYSDTWIMFLTFPLSFNSYKKVLAAMDSKILPHFKSPLNLTDFLINSYKIGGSVSLLSLSSLFLLITKYNLDYPDFYTNFYQLLTPEILHVKYRSRFLYWADVFLSSTNLPAYVVASFVKKFSRLALLASVETLYPLIPLIGNLLIRHPNLMELFNKSGKNDIDKDPFKFEETNLKETKALDSSLWELKSLQKHWNQEVRQAAKFINYTLPKDEFDLSDLLSSDFPELVEQAFSNDVDEDVDLDIEVGEVALGFFVQ